MQGLTVHRIRSGLASIPDCTVPLPALHRRLYKATANEKHPDQHRTMWPNVLQAPKFTLCPHIKSSVGVCPTYKCPFAHSEEEVETNVLQMRCGAGCRCAHAARSDLRTDDIGQAVLSVAIAVATIVPKFVSTQPRCLSM